MHQTFHYFAIVEILFDDFSSELRLFIQNACRINLQTNGETWNRTTLQKFWKFRLSE